MINFTFISLIFYIFYIKHIKKTIISYILAIFYVLYTSAYFVADYFTDDGINSAVIYHLKYGLNGAGWAEYSSLIISVFALVIFNLILIYKFRSKKTNTKLSFIFLILAFLTSPTSINLYKLNSNNTNTNNTEFKKYFKQSSISNQKHNNTHNLIYIYLESLEKTYFDQKLFPNLLPNLTALKKYGIELTNIKQVTDTGWTVAGMTANECGVPLSIDGEGNSMSGVDSFLDSAVCIGDLLKSQNYNLSYISGTTANFAGVDKLYKSHSFDEVLDYYDLKFALKNPQYINNWGMYDDTMFNILFNGFIDKSIKYKKSGQKFAIYMATMDTHPPSGYISATCKQKDIKYQDGKNQMLNALACSDYLISNFIKSVYNTKYGKDTTIVISNDHLSMKNDVYDLLKKGDRKDFVLIFNPISKLKSIKKIDKPGSMLDIGATTLGALGFEANIGFGVNLFSDEKSLLQKVNGVQNANKILKSSKDEIAKLWNYPKYQNVKIDKIHHKIIVDGRSFATPVIFKLDNDNNILSAIFEIQSSKPLSYYAKKFKKENQKFVWIKE